MTRCLTDSPAPVVMTMGTPGQCVHFCATSTKAWSVKCKWENRCDACAQCAGGCFSFERVIDVRIEGLWISCASFCGFELLFFARSLACIPLLMCTLTKSILTFWFIKLISFSNFSTHFRIDLAEPTKKATTEPNLNGECQGWCADHAHPWKAKCKWKDRCDACPECSGELHTFNFCKVCNFFRESMSK